MNMGSVLRGSQRWIQRHFDATYLLAFVLMVLGAVVFFTARGVAWVQGTGGVIVGTGFTVLVTTITGKRAIHEQYSKEANLKRKYEVYGPLHSELKSLRETLDDARAGRGPYPGRVDLATDPNAPSLVNLPSTYPDPTFQLWSVFKQDVRINDFTAISRALLDEVHNAATAYNEAVKRVTDPTIAIVAQAADTAIENVDNSAEYKEWVRQNEERENLQVPVGHEPRSERDWYKLLLNQPSQGTTRGQAWASSWVRSWPIYYRPSTLGWLLASKADRAAAFVRAGYQQGPNVAPAPPLEWIKSIFEAAQLQIDQHDAYHAARTAQGNLYAKVNAAEKRLDDGLRDIQDRYEGGSPPV